MGIKGTVRRSTDGHVIHANIDTDIIIAEEPTDGIYLLGATDNAYHCSSFNIVTTIKVHAILQKHLFI